jgi:hypothetical protein
MMGAITTQLNDLVVTLRDLRTRLRTSARLEVALAVGDALREFALATICGSAALVGTPPEIRGWHDPWQQQDPGWTVEDDADDVIKDPGSGTTLRRSVIFGCVVGRWIFGRTKQPAPALIAGALVTVLALVGGPLLDSVLSACVEADETLHDRSH